MNKREWDYYKKQGAEETEFWLDMLVKIWRGFSVFIWYYIAFIIMFFWLPIGILFSVTIIGLPVAKKIFAMSVFLFKHSKEEIKESKVELNFGQKPVANTLWCCTFGLIYALIYILFGIWSIMSLIFIPQAPAYFKMAKYVFAPFSAELVEK